jgi:hypothetical protein
MNALSNNEIMGSISTWGTNVCVRVLADSAVLFVGRGFATTEPRARGPIGCVWILESNKTFKEPIEGNL